MKDRIMRIMNRWDNSNNRIRMYNRKCKFDDLYK